MSVGFGDRHDDQNTFLKLMGQTKYHPSGGKIDNKRSNEKIHAKQMRFVSWHGNAFCPDVI